MLLFGVQALLAAVLEYGNRIGNDNKHSGASTEFLSFRNNYLVVYSLMMGKNTPIQRAPLKCPISFTTVTLFLRSILLGTFHHHLTTLYSFNLMQLVTGFKALMYMLFTNIMVSSAETLAVFSLLVLGHQ